MRSHRTDSVLTLMEAINAARLRVWEKQPEDFLWQAFVDIDGTLAGTLGECKGGMALSYKGIWGYAPLIITLANTREVRCRKRRNSILSNSRPRWRLGMSNPYQALRFHARTLITI